MIISSRTRRARSDSLVYAKVPFSTICSVNGSLLGNITCIPIYISQGLMIVFEDDQDMMMSNIASMAMYEGL